MLTILNNPKSLLPVPLISHLPAAVRAFSVGLLTVPFILTLNVLDSPALSITPSEILYLPLESGFIVVPLEVKLSILKPCGKLGSSITLSVVESVVLEVLVTLIVYSAVYLLSRPTTISLRSASFSTSNVAGGNGSPRPAPSIVPTRQSSLVIQSPLYCSPKSPE